MKTWETKAALPTPAASTLPLKTKGALQDLWRSPAYSAKRVFLPAPTPASCHLPEKGLVGRWPRKTAHALSDNA